MPTLAQALQLGSGRLTTVPSAPHATLQPAWSALDWSGARETALLDAAALAGAARIAGAPTGPIVAAQSTAPDEIQPLVPARAAEILSRLADGEWRPLLSEWLELCANRGWLVPPLWLPRLLGEVANAADRGRLRRVMGERGRWLARQNPAWSWVHAVAPEPDLGWWENGSDDERLGCLRVVRAADPARAGELVAQTWADDPPEFRARALELLRPGLSRADEPFLTAALGDRRKDVRQTAQSFLALIPDSALAARMRARGERLLRLQRGLLGRKLEVDLPAAFDSTWKLDAIEEKPPAGVGEKAFWTLQILALLPLQHWVGKFGLPVATLVELARKCGDWADLLLAAWYRATILHGDAEAAAALIKPVLGDPKFLPPGVNQTAAIRALLGACDVSERWRLIGEQSSLAWPAIDLLAGTPTLEQGRTLLQQIAPAMRDGFNPGGSPAAVVAARLVPPALRDEAAQLLARDNGLTKPAEMFLQALDLRAALHAAFSN